MTLRACSLAALGLATAISVALSQPALLPDYCQGRPLIMLPPDQQRQCAELRAAAHPPSQFNAAPSDAATESPLPPTQPAPVLSPYAPPPQPAELAKALHPLSTPEERERCRGAPFGGLPWKDYLSRTGNKLGEWRTFEADNGAVTAVDMKFLSPLSEVPRADLRPPNFVRGVQVQAYVVEGDCFDLQNLRDFTFDCRGHFTVRASTWEKPGFVESPMVYAPPRSVAGQIEAIVCKAVNQDH